jgi:ABC-2 type transport system permease protein
MIRILDIAAKDLLQILRDRKTFLFLLIMPVVFTFLFGFAFGGFSKPKTDQRMPVVVINDDNGMLSQKLVDMFAGSNVIAITLGDEKTRSQNERSLTNGKLAGILLIPVGYSQTLQDGKIPVLTLETDLTQNSGTVVQGEVLSIAVRLTSAVQAALIIADDTGDFSPILEQVLAGWENPPITIETTTATVETVETQSQAGLTLAHTSPAMMLQFAIAGLLTCATVIVNERKTRSLQRLLTTATRRSHILLGHYLAIFSLIFTQFIIMLTFGQIVLKINYLRLPGAVLLVALAASLCIAALGLLIGVLARSEEQAIAFSLIPMFVFSGLGGAWTPLEYTSATFQAIGHVTPVAWAMDGFKNITVRLLGTESVLLPVAALFGYALLFFLLAIWRFSRLQEQ